MKQLLKPIRIGASRTSFIRFLPTAFSLLLVFIFGIAVEGLAYAQDCSGLSPEGGQGSQLGYQPRGNRCEGLYKSNVGGGILVISLVQGNLGSGPGDLLSVVPSFNPQVPINIRALPLSISIHYRMDATIPAGSKLKWPRRDVLFHIPLATSDLGVYGWFGPENDKVLVPVQVTRDDISPAPAQTTLILRSSINVTQAVWSWSPVEGNECGSFNKAKRVQPISRGGAKLIKLSLAETGLTFFCVEVRVQEGNGDWLPPLRTKIRTS